MQQIIAMLIGIALLGFIVHMLGFQPRMLRRLRMVRLPSTSRGPRIINILIAALMFFISYCLTVWWALLRIIWAIGRQFVFPTRKKKGNRGLL